MSSASVTSTSTIPTSSAQPDSDPSNVHNDLNPIVSFIIGLSIILAASIMNAGGLNLVKLDMVKTMELPKAQRRRDYLRPLWLFGMILYIMSQLIGSTLALEFLRAEYVAPLGSSSLVFNFIFASWLVGTPVTWNDIWGTVVVVFGVIGIVAFGSINKGLISSMNIDLLRSLWSRAGWLSYFIICGILPIFIVYIGAAQLETVLHTRMDILSEPNTPKPTNARAPSSPGFWARLRIRWNDWMHWTRGMIERWSTDKSDKTLAWTLGICWACCGGALAGGTLVFAKASVKLISGKLSHRNTGNQFVHPASIFTFIFLASTAVLQILCLNRGLRAYDSTLVVPVFYGVYTASGFLDSLIFNDEVDSYQTWTLFLIFTSILILIGGVVLLTLKKPEPKKTASASTGGIASRFQRARRAKPAGENGSAEREREREDDEISLTEQGGSKDITWEIGDDDSDDDNELVTKGNLPPQMQAESSRRMTIEGNGESRGLMSNHEDGDDNEFGEFTKATQHH